MQPAVVNLSLAEIFEFPGCKVALQLFKFVLLGLNIKSSLLNSELCAAGPVRSFVTKAHAVGLDRKLSIQILLAIVEFGHPLVFGLLLRLSHLLLHLQTASNL